MKSVIKFDGNLSNVIPSQHKGKKEYSETHLQVIRRGLESSIDRLSDKAILTMQLFKIAHDFGFDIDGNDEAVLSRIATCCEVILASYSFLSVEQIRHAFVIAPLTGVNMEAYGKDFNATYLQRVLNAYVSYIKVVLPSIKNAEKIAANRAKAAEKAKQEIEKLEAFKAAQRRLYYVNVCKNVLKSFLELEHGVLNLETIDSQIIKVLSKAGLVHFTRNEKQEFKQQAKQLANDALLREATQVQDAKGLTNTQKAIKKRNILKLSEVLVSGNVNKDAQGIITVWVCRIGLKQWLINHHVELDGEVLSLKRKIMTAFYKKGWITIDDNFEFDVELQTQKIIKNKAAVTAEL